MLARSLLLAKASWLASSYHLEIRSWCSFFSQSVTVFQFRRDIDAFYEPYFATKETRYNEMYFCVDHEMVRHFESDLRFIIPSSASREALQSRLVLAASSTHIRCPSPCDVPWPKVLPTQDNSSQVFNRTNLGIVWPPTLLELAGVGSSWLEFGQA